MLQNILTAIISSKLLLLSVSLCGGALAILSSCKTSRRMHVIWLV